MFSANNCRPNQKIKKRAFASTNLSIALSKDSNCLDREHKNGKNEQIGFSSRCHISLWYCTLPTVDMRYTFGVGCSIFKRIQCKIFDKCKMFKLYRIQSVKKPKMKAPLLARVVPLVSPNYLANTKTLPAIRTWSK